MGGWRAFSAEIQMSAIHTKECQWCHHMGLPYGSQWMLCGPLVGKIPFLLSKALFELWNKLGKLSEENTLSKAKGFFKAVNVKVKNYEEMLFPL